MDPLSIITSSLAIVGAVAQTYASIQTIAGLPEAFRHVESQLPLVESTLRHAKSRLRAGPDPTDEEDAALCAIIQPCHARMSKLRDIVESLKKRRDSDKEKASWPRLRGAYRTLLEGKKANRVEDLMRAVLEDLKTLALHQVFQTATAADVKLLESALTDLAKVAPSMDEAEIEKTRGPIQATMNVANGGTGQQNNVQGDGSTFNSGENVVVGQGHTIYFGAVTIFQGPQEQKTDDQLPACSILPSWDAAYFVGRGDLLEKLRQAFNRGLEGTDTGQEKGPTVVVLSGIGGQGKSQTALRYRRQARGYEAVFWVNATTCETTRRSFEAIAAEMSADRDRDTDTDTDILDERRLVTWDTVTETLAGWRQKKWLLVFDNHDDPEHFGQGAERFSKLADFFPAKNNGSIIVTTRDARVGRGRAWLRFEVGAMPEDDALKLLRQHSSDGALSPGEAAAGRTIVRMLGGLVLAVAQTAWFVETHALGLQTYLERFAEFKASALATGLPASASDHALNCSTTYEHSLASLPDATREATTAFLTLAAAFSDASIHDRFIEHYVRSLSPSSLSSLSLSSWLAPFAPWDWIAYSTCVADLADRNLVQRPRDSTDGLRFSLHPVIREWLLQRVGGASSAPAAAMTRTAVAVLAAFLRTGNIYAMTLSTRQDVLAHINKFYDEGTACLYQPAASAPEQEPALVFARFCREFSRLKRSRQLLEALLDVRRRAGQPDSSPGSVAVLVELGHTHADNAESTVGAAYYEQALQQQQASTHAVVDVLMRSDAQVGQALCLAMQQKRGARELAERARQEAEQHLAADPDTGADTAAWHRIAVRARIVLSNVLGQRGLLEAADAMARTASAAASQALGADDNLALEAALNVHQAVAARGEPEVAIRIILDVLRRIESRNGRDHRWALNARMSLGLIYGRQASHARARRCFELCRQRAHALFGDSPGDVSIDLLIGQTYAAEKQWPAAEAIFARCARQSATAPGYETVRKQVTWSLLEMHLRRRQYLRALPHVAGMLLSFPFLSFARANRAQLLVTLGALVLFIDALVRRQLITLVVLGVTVTAAWGVL